LVEISKNVITEEEKKSVLSGNILNIYIYVGNLYNIYSYFYLANHTHTHTNTFSYKLSGVD